MESLSVHNKRTKDLDKETPQLPAELRANAPHLFRAPSSEPSGTDRFEKIVETPFFETRKAPLSTFSIDVDTASYSKIRQTIVEGNRLPNPNMVRIEEMVNYFEYGYAGPQDGRPFAAHMSIDQCPWNTEHQLVRIGLQARKLDMDKRVKANIVFLLDVSGSMNEPNKLPLVKKALSMMVEQLGGTLVTVAKDVKIQVDFNQAKVAGYRLIGYEDRRLANKGFDNDQKDASEVGAGHRVTALYEVIPAGKWVGIVRPSESETSKYSKNPKLESGAEKSPNGEFPAELLTLKVRYKEPEGSVSTKQEFVLNDTDRGDQPLVDRDMQWATSVAEFGLLLRRSEMAPQADWTEILERASSSAGGDAYWLECLAMMRKARSMFR